MITGIYFPGVIGPGEGSLGNKIHAIIKRQLHNKDKLVLISQVMPCKQNRSSQARAPKVVILIVFSIFLILHV